MLTEEEAKTKWCPFTRVGNEAGCNRNQRDFEGRPMCIASKCMCWHIPEKPNSLWVIPAPSEEEARKKLPEGQWELQSGTVYADGSGQWSFKGNENKYGDCGLKR